MANHHTSFLLTFQVLQFVNQIRRRLKPRTRHGSTRLCRINASAPGLHALKNIPTRLQRIRPRRNVKTLHHGCGRVCKKRKNNVTIVDCVSRRGAPGWHVPANSDAAGDEVQQYVRGKLRVWFRLLSVWHSMLSSVDNLNCAKHTLSTVAGNDGLFLKHDNAPIFEGFSQQQIFRLLLTVQEAINTLSTCRSQYGDDWLIAQGLGFGLDIDENFIANYEHLLLRLQNELVQAYVRKATTELLRGGHNKQQRRLLAWFSEFAEKPRPLSTSFPWTIKPSLAVLWGVCWMFYDRDSSEPDGRGGNRVPKEKVLQNLDYINVPWSAPASSDCKCRPRCCFSSSSSVSVLS